MKTVICDIDGTIFEYVKGGHYDLVYREAKLLPGVREKFVNGKSKVVGSVL